MTFHKLNVPNGQTALAGLVLYQFKTVKIQKQFGLSSVGFLLKKIIYLIYIN